MSDINVKKSGREFFIVKQQRNLEMMLRPIWNKSLYELHTSTTTLIINILMLIFTV
ncbi:MAG: hypothetical protein MHMPM18_002636 [Marteilia pararefringens]